MIPYSWYIVNFLLKFVVIVDLLCYNARMAEIFVDSLFDAVLDSLKVLPVLFLAYLLVAWLSHDHSHKFSRFLSKNKKTSVLYASFLGCVPQCGFSSVMADLYSERHVSLGALLAVFIATSDEAVPIMLSNVTNTSVLLDMLKLVGIKIVLALVFGYAIEGVASLVRKKRQPHKEEILPPHDHSHDHKHECGHIHTDECVVGCGHEHGGCAENIFLDAFMHTFEIVIYIFIAAFILNFVSEMWVDALATLLTNNVYVQILIASLIGLIPNCAASVFLVELYISGTLYFPALLAGLSSCAGVGVIILWARNRRHPLENLGILALQFALGVISGLLLSLIL